MQRLGFVALIASKPSRERDLVCALVAARIIAPQTKLDFAEWGDAFPNKLLGASTLDRLRHGAYRLIMDSKSYRKPRPLKKPPKDKLEIDPKKEK